MGRIADAIRGVAMPDQKKRQMLSLDQQFSEMEAEIKSLKTENLHLQAEVNPLQRQIDALKQQIQKLEQESSRDVRAGLVFNAHTGLWADSSGQRFCTKCLDQQKRNPLRTDKYGKESVETLVLLG